MKRLFLIPLVMVLALALVFGGCAKSAPEAKPVEINWTHFEPDVPAAYNDLHREFAKQVGDKTQGRVKIDIRWGSVLGKITEYPQMVSGGGVAQGGTMPGTFAMADLPFWSAPGLPFFTSGYKVAPRAIWALGNEWDVMQKEAEKMNMKIVGVTQMDPAVILTKEKISSIADLKGKKMTALSYWAALMPELGIAHVALGGGETVDALQKGLIFGLWGNTYGTSKRLKQYEQCKYQYLLPLGGNTVVLYAINKGVWDKISAKDQKTIQAIFDDLTVNFYPKALDTDTEAVREFYKSQGVTESVLPDADYAKVRDIGKPMIINDWLKKMKDRGLSGEEWIKRYEAKVKQFSQ